MGAKPSHDQNSRPCCTTKSKALKTTTEVFSSPSGPPLSSSQTTRYQGHEDDYRCSISRSEHHHRVQRGCIVHSRPFAPSSLRSLRRPSWATVTFPTAPSFRTPTTPSFATRMRSSRHAARRETCASPTAYAELEVRMETRTIIGGTAVLVGGPSTISQGLDEVTANGGQILHGNPTPARSTATTPPLAPALPTSTSSSRPARQARTAAATCVTRDTHAARIL